MSKRTQLSLLISVILTIGIGIILIVNAGQTQKELNMSDKALEYVSQKYGIKSDDLIIVNEAYANYTLSNRKIYHAKITARNYDLNIYEGVALDESGNIVDLKDIEAQENAAYYQKYGKLDVDLYEKLQNMNATEKVRVAIWLKSLNNSEVQYNRTPIAFLSRNDSINNSEAFEKSYQEFREAERLDNYKIQKPVIEAIEEKGFNVTYASQYALLLFAELSKEMIYELEKRDDVSAIYISVTYDTESDYYLLD